MTKTFATVVLWWVPQLSSRWKDGSKKKSYSTNKNMQFLRSFFLLFFWHPRFPRFCKVHVNSWLQQYATELCGHFIFIYGLLLTFCQQKSMWSPQCSMKHWPGQQQSLRGHPAGIALPSVEHTFLSRALLFSRAGTNTFIFERAWITHAKSWVNILQNSLCVQMEGKITACRFVKHFQIVTHYNRNEYTPALFLHQHDLIHFRRCYGHSSI